jgi:hypothetical protein
MARGGSTLDSFVCVICSGDTKMNWDQLKERKDAVFKKEKRQEDLEADLTRPSEHRTEAEQKGLLRPFMLLVSMSPAYRNQVACFLGWSLITEDYFGDPHAESWHILFKQGKGMQTRCHKSYEKANPLAEGCNWLDILSRVSVYAFRKDLERGLSQGVEELKQLVNSSSDPLIMAKEEEFLVEFVKYIKSNMTEKQRSEMEQQDPHVEEGLKRVFIQNCIFKTKEANWYALRLLSQLSVSEITYH